MALGLCLIGLSPALAQEDPPLDIPELDPHRYDPPIYDHPGPGAPPPEAAQPGPDAEAAARESEKNAARLDTLFTELAEPGRPDWEQVQAEIERLWSRSGSPTMDLLLRRAGAEMGAENYMAAVNHLTALTELAPDFAEGWNARATAFYQMGELSLAVSDIEHVLALNPRHYGALTGLGVILDQVGEPAAALKALREAERINPNRPDIQDSIKRVERSLGAQDL